jgi:hypothetical protein
LYVVIAAVTRVTRRARPAPQLRVVQQPRERRRERARVARRHEQAGLAVEHDLRRPADGRRDDRPALGHRLERRQRQPLGPRRERDDVRAGEERARVVAVAGEEDAAAHAEPLRLELELALEGAVPLEVPADQHEPRPRQPRQRPDQLALALHVAEPAELRHDGRAGRDAELRDPAVRPAARRDAVVDDLDPARGIPLALVGAARVLGHRDEPRAQPRRPVVERAQERRRRRAEVVLDVEVRDDGDARAAGRQARERVRGGERVRVHDVVVPREPRQPARAAEAKRAADVGAVHGVALVLRQLDERPRLRDRERVPVPPCPRGARELERDHLAARDLAADEDVEDLHRQTARTSLAPASAPRSIAIPSLPTSAIGAVPESRRETGRRNVSRRRSPSTSSRCSAWCRRVCRRRWP